MSAAGDSSVEARARTKAEYKARALTVRDRLAPLAVDQGASVEVKAMFGGWSFRLDAITFGFVSSDGNVMWRADDQTRPKFEAAGAKQFIYTHVNTGRVTRMPYWALPALPDDPIELNDWAALALTAARRAAKDKPQRKKRA